MKKTLSIVFALIFALSACVCASAINIFTDADLKSMSASFMGFDESKMQDFKSQSETSNFITSYEVTFKYDNVTYKINYSQLGTVTDFEYSANKVIRPKNSDIYVSPEKAKNAAISEAGTTSKDAIFKTEKFAIKDGVAYYKYELLSKTAQWNIDIGAISGEVINSNHIDKNAFVMIFIRLFARIGIFF